MKLTVRELTVEAFAPFGQVLQAAQEGFQPLVVQEGVPGWQAALNNVAQRETNVIHRHFNTHECFAPLAGDPVVLVAQPGDPETVTAFRLTEPICVLPDVWHTTIAPSGSALVFICENTGVQGEEHQLPESITV